MELILNRNNYDISDYKDEIIYKFIEIPKGLDNYILDGKDIHEYLNKYLSEETQNDIANFILNQNYYDKWFAGYFEHIMTFKIEKEDKIFIFKSLRENGEQIILNLEEFEDKIY